MRRYLLDTGPAQDFIHKRDAVHARANELLAAGNRLGVGMPVVGELFAGVEYSATRERNYSILMRRLHNLLLWPFDRGMLRRSTVDYLPCYEEVAAPCSKSTSKLLGSH